MSRVQKPIEVPWNPEWFNRDPYVDLSKSPYIIGEYNTLYQTTNQSFEHQVHSRTSRKKIDRLHQEISAREIRFWCFCQWLLGVKDCSSRHSVDGSKIRPTTWESVQIITRETTLANCWLDFWTINKIPKKYTLKIRLSSDSKPPINETKAIWRLPGSPN